MAQFDVHVLRDKTLVVDASSDVVGSFGTRFVIPLVSRDDTIENHSRLHPTIRFKGDDYLLATHLAGAIATTMLGPPKGSLVVHEFVIKSAIDMLITGY